MSGYATYNEVLVDTIKNRHIVPVIEANKINFSKYGRFVYSYNSEDVIINTWPKNDWRPICKGTGMGGGVVKDIFQYWREDNYMKARNMNVIGNYTTGITTNNFESILTREANYHPDSGQVFYPIKKTPFLLLLALPGDDIKLSDFVAFCFDGTHGVQIYPNIWHQPVYPKDETCQFLNKQGSVHACVSLDTIEEFNAWLEIPLFN